MAEQQEGKEGLRGQLTYINLMFKGLLSVSKLLIFDFKDVKKLRKTSPLEQRYIRPPRRYEIPEFSPNMPFCQSKEKYLRPTRYCNSHSPEVIALANELGAYKLPDREFAQVAFEFAKEKLTLEIAPLVSVEEILHRGTGSCFELITVFIALCRASGIKARYKIFATHMIQAWREGTIDADPLLNKWYDSLGYFLLEGEGEAFIDGKWMVAHVGPTAERQASAGIPITQLGEDALGIWFTARPGSIMLLESLPVGLATGTRILHKISPGTMERVNVSVLNENEKGGEIIKLAGGVHVYDQQMRAGSQK